MLTVPTLEGCERVERKYACKHLEGECRLPVVAAAIAPGSVAYYLTVLEVRSSTAKVATGLLWP